MLNEVKQGVPKRFTTALPLKLSENKWFIACYCSGRRDVMSE